MAEIKYCGKTVIRKTLDTAWRFIFLAFTYETKLPALGLKSSLACRTRYIRIQYSYFSVIYGDLFSLTHKQLIAETYCYDFKFHWWRDHAASTLSASRIHNILAHSSEWPTKSMGREFNFTPNLEHSSSETCDTWMERHRDSMYSLLNTHDDDLCYVLHSNDSRIANQKQTVEKMKWKITINNWKLWLVERRLFKNNEIEVLNGNVSSSCPYQLTMLFLREKERFTFEWWCSVVVMI